MKKHQLFLSTAFLFCGFFHAIAAEITLKSGWTGALNEDAAWVGDVAPGEADIAVFSGVGGSFGLGADLAWKGMVVTNAPAELSITNDTHVLTLGSAGVTPGSATAGTAFYVNLYCPIVIQEDQEWYFANFKSLHIWGTVSGAGALTLRNYPNYASAQYVLHNTNSVAHLGIHGSATYLRDQAVLECEADTEWNHHLYLDYDGVPEKQWRDIFTTRSFANDGQLHIGSDWRAVATMFHDGDRLAGTSYSLASQTANHDPLSGNGTGQLCVHYGRFQMDGGSISNNIITVRQGRFLQSGGDVYTRFGVGGFPGFAADQIYALSGDAAVSAESFNFGNMNGENYVSSMIVSNGSAVARGAGVVLATDYGSSAYGTLEIAGGSLTTPQVRFGGVTNAAVNTNAIGLLALSGGTLNIGAGGIRRNPYSWNTGLKEDSPSRAWCEMRISGGLYKAIASHENDVTLKLMGPAAFDTEIDAFITQSAPVTGPGALVKTGEGLLTLSSVNAYTGATVVAAGSLAIRSAASFSPKAAWCADDLSVAEGASVDVWNSSGGTRSYAFTKATAQAINGVCTSPKLSANRINGHKAVAFDGSLKNMLAMTGGANEDLDATPVRDAESLTVAVVLKVTASEGSDNNWRLIGGVIGSDCDYSSNLNNWGLGLDQNGYAVAGVVCSNVVQSSVWNSGKSVIDGNAHVVIYSWKANESLAVNVDGQRVSDTPIAMGALAKCRITLGGHELTGTTLKFITGEIAEIRIYKDGDLDLQAEDEIGQALALKYGLAYVQQGSLPQEPTMAELPAPTGLWSADSLSGAPGSSVAVWKDTILDGEFNTTVANAIFTSANVTAPTLSAEPMNGHKAVKFDGNKDVLAMTGGKCDQYLGRDTINHTVAMVIRTQAPGKGLTNRSGWPFTAGLLGQVYNSTAQWGIGFSPRSQIGAGVKDGANDNKSAFSHQRLLNDGQPHVIIYSCGSNQTVNADGERATATNCTAIMRNSGTRTTLGRYEIVGGYYAGAYQGDIAELRIYKDTLLSVAQQNALGLELAKKYGADTAGYADGSAFASRAVTVAENASICLMGSGLRIKDGQRFDGAGTVAGTLVVGDEGLLVASEAALTVQNLVLEDGAVLQVDYDEAGQLINATTAESLTLQAGEISVDARPVSPSTCRPYGVLLRWNDDFTDNGATWRIAGGKTLKVTVDEVKKEIRISPSGLLISIH